MPASRTFPVRPRSSAARRARRHGVPLLPVWVGIAVACGGDAEPEPLEVRFCHQLEACQYLVSGGFGACVDDARRCTTSLSGADRRAWAGRVERCLSLAVCAGFAECYLGSHPAC